MYKIRVREHAAGRIHPKYGELVAGDVFDADFPPDGDNFESAEDRVEKKKKDKSGE